MEAQKPDPLKYFLISMPMNEKGEGPETNPSLIKFFQYQIWDENNTTISIHRTLEEAQAAFRRLYQAPPIV